MFKIEIELKTNDMNEAKEILSEVIEKIKTTGIYSANYPKYYYNVEDTKLFEKVNVEK